MPTYATAHNLAPSPAQRAPGSLTLRGLRANLRLPSMCDSHSHPSLSPLTFTQHPTTSHFNMLRSLILICLMLGPIGCEQPARQSTTELGFFKAPFVHPASIEFLAGFLSDRHPNIIALDLEESQDSNQIARALDFEVIPNEAPDTAPWIQMSETHPHDEVTYFKYSAIRQDPDGIIYLKCYSWGGGSGYWSHHMAVQIINDTQIRYDENDVPYKHTYSMLKLVGHLPNDFFE